MESARLLRVDADADATERAREGGADALGRGARGTSASRLVGVLACALAASLAMNGMQYASRARAERGGEVGLGNGRFALAAPRGVSRAARDEACGHAPRFSLMCVGEREDRGAWRSNAMLGQAADPAAGASLALNPATGPTRYCRKDTWLLSCLFYKANINDEATDWKHVKEECDGEFECDGINKYWTSDLWHIASSGNANGCDGTLDDGEGTDASAFYKEGSAGWRRFGPEGDGSCKVVNIWGNPE